MKEAKFYKKLKDKIVQCELCPHYCTLKEGEVGNCKARKNIEGKLYSLVYGKLCSTAVDPIEKKPLFHFLPGSSSYSIATAGCNLHCLFCQNWGISQARPEEIPHEAMEPKDVVEEAVRSGCQSISYTYTEPTIMAEFILDTAKLASKKGIRNVMISNGFINQKPLKAIYKYIDAANIDLKGFTEEFYKNICGARLSPVLETLKSLKKMKVWAEVTNLVIPTLNGNPEKIKEMCIWIRENLGEECPLHFSRFFPMYKLMNIDPTPKEALERAYKIAKDAGLNYVYLGNLWAEREENTYCPKCNELVVRRSGFSIGELMIKKGKCINGHKIAGVWK